MQLEANRYCIIIE